MTNLEKVNGLLEQVKSCSLGIKIGIIFSLNPVDKGIQHFLLRKVIKRSRMEVVGVSLA